MRSSRIGVTMAGFRSGSNFRCHGWWSGAGLILMLFALWTAGPAAASPEWRVVGCPTGSDTSRLTCGVLAVPERRDRPDSRTIDVHAVIVRSLRPTGAAPVLFLTGGPGQDHMVSTADGLNGWRDYVDGAMTWADGRDVIVLAQRGTMVRGGGLACRSVGDPALYLGAGPSPRDLTDWRANMNAANADCRAEIAAQGADPAGYSTPAIAADAAALRAALGIPAWVVYGISYGTRVALELLRQDAGGVSAAILDSVFPPEVTDHWTDGRPFETALDGLYAACAADAGCAAAFPDLGPRTDALLARLAAAPVILAMQIGGRGSFIALDDVALIDMIYFNLYWHEGIAVLPRALDALARGNIPRFVADVAQPFVQDALFENWAYGMQIAVSCNDDGAWLEPQAIAAAERRHPRLARWFATLRDVPPCAGWPMRGRAAGGSAPVASDVPVLLLAGAIDPVTPPAYAMAARAHLSRGRLVVIGGAAHAVLDSVPCAAPIVAAFLADPAGSLGPACVAPAIDWALP